MGILSNIVKNRKGRKNNKEAIPEPEPPEEKPVDEDIPKDDLYVTKPSLDVNQSIYISPSKESYGRVDFDPEPPHNVQMMSAKGFHLALEYMKCDHNNRLPEYADQFVRTCLYSKNLEIRALIEFCRTYPNYSGLRKELLSKLKSDGNFVDTSCIFKNVSSAKGIESSIIKKMRYEIASAVAEYIRGHESFNYVESLHSDRNLSECIQTLLCDADPKFNSLCKLMLDALRGMMNSSQDSEMLNRIYYGTFSDMKGSNLLDEFDKDTESCYWNNVIRFMNKEADIEHFGTMMRDVKKGSYPWDQPDSFPSEVSNQYLISLDSLVVKPIMDGSMSFEDLRGKALLAMYLSKYCGNSTPEMKAAVIKAIAVKFSQNTTTKEMSGMRFLMLSYRCKYNSVFNVELTEDDICNVYEDSVIGKVRDSEDLSESNLWYLHANPRVCNEAMSRAMLDSYCGAIANTKTMDELFDCYSKIEDPAIIEAGASVFSRQFFNMIDGHSCGEYEAYMSKLDDTTREETLLFMGNNYPCIDWDISFSILDDVRDRQYSDMRYRDVAVFQSESLIKGFMDVGYEGMFLGYRIVDPGYAKVYVDLLKTNGKHPDDLLSICMLMRNSGLDSELEDEFDESPWYDVCTQDPKRKIIFGQGPSEFTNDGNDLSTRIESASKYMDALISTGLKLTDRKRFMEYVSDSMGSACESFGSEAPLGLSKSLYDYMLTNNILCMGALLSYSFVLVLEGRYRNLPELSEDIIGAYPDESALYGYVRSYMEWFGGSSAEKVGRFPLDIDSPLKHARTTFQKAMVYYIRSEVSQFFGNGQLVYDGWNTINNDCKGGAEYALLRKKISLMAYRYRLFEGNLDGVASEGVLRYIEPIEDADLKKLLQVYASYVAVATSRSSDDSNDRIHITRKVKSMIDNVDSAEYNAVLYYLNGCLLLISNRSGALEEFDKALNCISKSVLVWEGWPKDEPKRARESHISPVDVSVLYAEIKYHTGLCKRDKGENYHDDMIDALEELYDCPKSESLIALKNRIERDNKQESNETKAKVESTENFRLMKSFDLNDVRYQFEVSPRASGGHYNIHYGFRINEDGTQGLRCVMKAPKDVKFLSTATMTMDESAVMQFNREIECWEMLSSECPSKVVMLLDYGMSPHMFSISQYADITLKDAMLNMSRKQIISVMQDVLSVLEKIHEQGMIYNDMTPDNIMRVDGMWKLNDFDSVINEGEGSDVKRLTFLYNSPEQASGDSITCKSDIWSTGVVLYEALFRGKKPFDSQDGIMSMKFDDSRTVRTVYDKLFKSIFTVPEERPSASELIDILEEIKNEEM